MGEVSPEAGEPPASGGPPAGGAAGKDRVPRPSRPRHTQAEEIDEAGSRRRIEVAEAHHHVAELREDPELAVHAGGAAAVTVAPQRSLSLDAEAIPVMLFVGRGRRREARLGDQLPRLQRLCEP